jgi:membrane-associated protease RseP (regulator of RpoE activity)
VAASTALPPNPNELERLKSVVAQYFPVYETRVTPFSLVLLVHADPARLELQFDRMRQDLWERKYVCQIRREQGEYIVEVVRRPTRSVWGPVVNLILLIITAASTVAAGAFLYLAYIGGTTVTGSDFLYGGLYFALPLMTILGVHELAHYVMARHHHVEASLPYFIPVPPPYLLFGTFGAMISLREPIPDRKALLDIGASGPIAGFLVAVPVTFAGYFLSTHAPVLPVTYCGPTILGVSYGGLIFNPSLITGLIGLFFPPSLLNVHPLALAGWVGILVTAINLLPAGQLDGGHVARALFGDRSRYASYAAVIILVGLALVFGYVGWVLFAVLIVFLGMRHPPPLNDITPLDGKRLAVGGLAIALLVGGFVAVPIATPLGTFALSDQTWSSWNHTSLPPGTAMADNLSLNVVNQDDITHGYAIQGSISLVLSNASGSTSPLSGAALQAFEANSTWRVLTPNGTTTVFTGVGNWEFPNAAVTTLASGARANFQVQFEDSSAAIVDVSITVTQICQVDGGTSPQSYSVQIY